MKTVFLWILFCSLVITSATVLKATEKCCQTGCKCGDKCSCGGEEFLGTLEFAGKTMAVTSKTEVIYNGRQTPYFDVPDDTTELVEIGINLKRKVATKLVYKTKKDI